MKKNKRAKTIVYIILFSLIVFTIFILSDISSFEINPFKDNPEGITFKTEIDNGVKISYKDYSVTLVPYFVMKSGAIYEWDDIPSSIGKSLWIKKIDENRYKYGVDFSNISTAIKNNLNYVVLHKVNSSGLSLDDIELKGNTIIIKNKVFISHDDILSTYSIPVINKTDIFIGGLNRNWTECLEWDEDLNCITEEIKFNWKDNGDGTWNISFDPTIFIDETAIITTALLTNVTAEANFTHLNMSVDAPYDKLLGYWNFDGDLENIQLTKNYDWSQYNYDGTGVGNTTINNSGCIYGDCAHFYGESEVNERDGINLGTSLLVSENDSVTISLWFNPEVGQQSTDSRMASSVAECVMRYVNTNNYAEFILNSITTNDRINTSMDAIIPNTWNHIVGRYNGTDISIFLNGFHNGSVETIGAYTSCSTWYLGMQAPGAATTLFNGSIDEVMFFNSSLTAEQILDIYNNQSSRFVDEGTQVIQNIDLCYQETANVSTDCGGANTGVYWTENNYFYINYTSTGFTGATWKVSHGTPVFTNYTVDIPSDCFNNPIELRFYSNTTAFENATSYGQCKNSTEWKNITTIKTGTGSGAGLGEGAFGAYDGDWGTGAGYDESNNAWGTASGDDGAILEEGIHWLNNTNRINVTTYIDNNMGSLVNLILEYYNSSGWFSSDSQAVVSGAPLMYNISDRITTINLNYTLTAGNLTNPFYSPIIKNNITLEYWENEAEVPPDTTPPNMIILQPENITYNYNVADLNYTWVEINPDVCWASNDSGATNTSSVIMGTNLTLTSGEDFNNWTLWCNDTSANEGASSIAFSIDTIIPNIIILSPNNNSLTSNTQLDINFSVSDAETCWFTPDDGATNTTLTDCISNITAQTWAEGGNTIIVYANDSADNENSSSVYFILDTTYPTITIPFPENDYNYNYQVEVNYTYVEINPDTCWWTKDNGDTNTTFTACGDNITGQTWTEGTNNVTIYVNDTAGNYGVASVNFTIDTIIPSVSLLTENPFDPANYSFTQIYEFNATITDISIDIIIFEFDNKNYTPTIIGNVHNITLSGLSNNTYDYKWWANDTFGNLNNTETGDYSIWKVNITLTITGITEAGYGNASNFEGNETNEGDEDCIYELFANEINVSNPDSIVYGVGIINYTYNSTECTNYTSGTINGSFTITQAIGLAYAYINGTRDSFNATNTSLENHDNIYLNGTLEVGSGTIKLLLNGTEIAEEGVSPFNITNLSVGFYNLTSIYAGNENYTEAQERWDINVTLTLFEIEEGIIGGGWGGQTGMPGIGIPVADYYICNKTYKYIMTYGKQEAYISELIETIKQETNRTETWNLLNIYINNWQYLCSDLLSKTLNEEYVCKKLYYFIIQNNNSFSLEKINNLAQEIKENISISNNLLQYYISEYNTLCYSKGYSNLLPFQSMNIIYFESDLMNCSINTISLLFDWKIDLFKISIGDNPSCGKINLLKYFVALSIDNENKLFIIGIKIWMLFLLLILIFIFWLVIKLKKRVVPKVYSD